MSYVQSGTSQATLLDRREQEEKTKYAVLSLVSFAVFSPPSFRLFFYETANFLSVVEPHFSFLFLPLTFFFSWKSSRLHRKICVFPFFFFLSSRSLSLLLCLE